MSPRGTIVAALLAVEVAVIGVAVIAVRGGRPPPESDVPAGARAEADPRLREGGPHQIFDAAAHPVLSVDIGYADLTIRPSGASRIDVGLSASTAYTLFRATVPIVAVRDGGTIRIATTRRHPWSLGDDRMVTVLVPPQTRVTVTRAGNIEATGLRAESTFNSTGDGSITIDDYDAPTLHVVTADGRIVLRRIVAARLDAAGHGSIKGSALQLRDGSIVGSRRVTLGFTGAADTLITARTSGGTIGVTGFTNGGRGSSFETLRVGAGDGRLDVRSSDGDIQLARETPGTASSTGRR